MPRALLLTALPLLLLACGDKDADDSGDTGGGLDCTTEAAVSVMVTVSLADGASPPDDLSVTWSQDGGAAQDCEAWPDSPEFACGFEVAGDLDIEAAAAGYTPATATVTVGSGECHVVTEQATLTLEPEVTAGG